MVFLVGIRDQNNLKEIVASNLFWGWRNMKRSGDALKLIFVTPAGATTVLLLVACILFTISSIDIQNLHSQRNGLEWLFGVDELDLSLYEDVPGDHAPKSSTNSNLSSPDSNSAPELTEDASRVETNLQSHAPTDDEGLSMKWKYEVCLLVRIGKTAGRPALPYTELYRLFDAVRDSVSESRQNRGSVQAGAEIYVAADSPTLFCKMARDADLGLPVVCSALPRLSKVESNTCRHLVVGKTGRYTRQPSQEEIEGLGVLWKTRKAVDLDTEDPAREPPPLSESEWQPTIVTAFSSNHLEVGLLFLRSVGRAAVGQSAYNISIVVWTMNEFPPSAKTAFACVVDELQSIYKVQTEVRAFEFEAWPSWMRINQKRGYNGGRGEYAWKAIMVHTVLLERGFVYWADAGARFRTASALTETLDYVKRNGFASRNSSGKVKEWCHVKQLEYLDANKPHLLKQPNCDASGIGFTLRRYRELARPWYECSITRQCIAPDGSSRKNHRQDQAALTVITARNGYKCQGVSSGIARNTDNNPKGHLIGVDATKCYKDPLGLKWQ